MTFYLDQRLVPDLIQASQQDEKYKNVGKDVPFGLREIQLKQSELVESNAREIKRSVELKILLSLYKTYLESLSPDHSIQQQLNLIEDKNINAYEPNSELIQNLQKGFLKWLKSSSQRLQQFISQNPQDILYFRLLSLKILHLKQLQNISSRFQELSKTAGLIRTQLTKDSQLNEKRIAIYDCLLRNLQLRINLLAKRTNITERANQSTQQELQELKQKQEDIKRLIANNGWGYINKIKQKVNTIIRLKEQL